MRMNILRPLLPELTRDGWLRAGAWTLGTAVVTCVIAISASAFAKTITGGTPNLADIAIAILLSVVLAVPVIGTLSVKIQELRLANEKIQRYATTDPMTGLLNRDTFTRVVETFLTPPPAERRGHGPGCLLAIDVDHFKLVNDTFGHHWGDEALKLIASTVRAELRDYDLCGRMGGEEFDAFLVGAGLAEAIDVADRIRRSVTSAGFTADGLSCPLSVSIGIGVAAQGESFIDLYRDGDKLLYRAKRNGRNRTETPDESIPPESIPDAWSCEVPDGTKEPVDVHRKIASR